MAFSSFIAPKPFRTLGRWLFRLIAFAACTFGIVVLLLFLFLTLQGERATAYTQSLLREQTGMPWLVQGEVKLVFVPGLGLAATRVALPAATMPLEKEAGDAPLFAVAEIRCHLDMLSLLRGHVRLSRVVLKEPAVVLSYTRDGRPLWEREAAAVSPAAVPVPIAAQQTPGSPIHPSAPAGYSPATVSSVPLAATAESPPVVSGQPEAVVAALPVAVSPLDALAAFLHGPLLQEVPMLTVANGTIRQLSPQGGLVLAVEKIELGFDPSAHEYPLDLSTSVVLPGAGLRAEVNVHAGPGEGDELLSGMFSSSVELAVPQSDAPIRGSISTPFSLLYETRALALPLVQIEAESDRLSASLRVALDSFSCAGKVQIEQLSLPRWFMFGRNLPPELQRVLHTLKGECDLFLDAQGVAAKNLVADAGGNTVVGYVQAVDFSAPVVEVDIRLPNVDVDTLFPFLAPADAVVPVVHAPEFSFPFLVPFPVDPSAPGGADDLPDVGYDIRIHVDQAVVHGVQGGPVAVRVFPVPGGDVCRVAFSGENLLRGSLEGSLDIDRTYVKMQYQGRGLHLGLLPENQNADTQVGGVFTGGCTIDVPVDKGVWGKDWRLTAHASLTDFVLTGDAGKRYPWFLRAQRVALRGEGLIHAVVKDGVTVSGDFRVENQGTSSSWNPNGSDQNTIRLLGGLAWPPVGDAVGAQRERRGMNRLHGDVTMTGAFVVPLGNVLVPITGTLNSALNWRIDAQTVQLNELVLNGLGSLIQGNILLDFSNNDFLLTASSRFTIAPRDLLKEWNLLPARGILMPEKFTGSTDIRGTLSNLTFGNMRMEVDGAALYGDIRCDFTEFLQKQWTGVPQSVAILHQGVLEGSGIVFSGEMEESTQLESPRQPGNTLRHAARVVRREVAIAAGKALAQQKREAAPTGRGRLRPHIDTRVNALWTFRLSGAYLDVDKFFPAKEEGQAVEFANEAIWDLSAFQGLQLDIQLNLDSAKFQKLVMGKVTVNGRLQRERFILHVDSRDFYGGRAQHKAQGVVVVPSELRLTRFETVMQDFNVGQALAVLTGNDNYGGQGSLNFSIAGVMRSAADMPRGLSGTWNFFVEDGRYPSVGFGNTFSRAEASGVLEKGVLRWQDFSLRGPIVNIRGGGWADLDSRTLDVNTTITVARIPTIPVRITGSFESPAMSVRGTHMVLKTVQAAGGTVFSLVQGVFDLPASILSGIGNILTGGGRSSTRGEGE